MTSIQMAPAFGQIILKEWQHYVSRTDHQPVHSALTFQLDGEDKLGQATSMHVRTEGAERYGYLFRDEHDRWVPKTKVNGTQLERVMGKVVNGQFDTAPSALKGPAEPKAIPILFPTKGLLSLFGTRTPDDALEPKVHIPSGTPRFSLRDILSGHAPKNDGLKAEPRFNQPPPGPVMEPFVPGPDQMPTTLSPVHAIKAAVDHLLTVNGKSHGVAGHVNPVPDEPNPDAVVVFQRVG